MENAYRNDYQAALHQIAALERENRDLRREIARARAAERAAEAARESNGSTAFILGTMCFLALVGTALIAGRPAATSPAAPILGPSLPQASR